MTRSVPCCGTRLRPAIENMTDLLLDRMADRGADGSRVEFMHDVAFLLRVTVICELVGIREADRESFRPVARALAATVEIGIDAAVLASADEAAIWLNEYFAELAALRRADPRDDLMSALVEINDAEDGRLSDTELLDNLTLLLVAGFETTTNLLGNGVQIIVHRPEVAAAVRAESIPVTSFVEEVLRYDSPVQFTSRRRLDTADIRGVPVTSDDDIMLMLGAGNRDGRRFPRYGCLPPGAGKPAARSASAAARTSAWVPRSPGWRLPWRSRACLPASQAWLPRAILSGAMAWYFAASTRCR
jgi:cytochrome P450